MKDRAANASAAGLAAISRTSGAGSLEDVSRTAEAISEVRARESERSDQGDLRPHRISGGPGKAPRGRVDGELLGAAQEILRLRRQMMPTVPLAATGTDCGVAFPTAQAADARPSDDLPHSSTPHAPSHDHGGRRIVDVSSEAGHSESPASYLKYNAHSVQQVPIPRRRDPLRKQGRLTSEKTV